MKKVYLHVGLHKTATTSFQLTCKMNNEKLLKQGFLYPIFNSPHILLEDMENHSVPFFSLYSDMPKNYHVNIHFGVSDIEALHQDYLLCIEKALKAEETVIFSGEDIPHLSHKKLHLLKSFFEGYNIELIPIAVVRSPYAFACSQTQEVIRDGKYVETFLPKQSPTINKLQQVFPDIRFFPFNEICKHTHGPTGFLLEEMGVNCADFNFVQSNRGLSNIIIRVQNILSKRNANLINHVINPHFIRVECCEKKAFTQPYLLTEKEFSLVKDAFVAEYKSLTNILGQEFVDEKISFSVEDPTVNLCEFIIENLEEKYERQQAQLEVKHKEEKLLLQKQLEEKYREEKIRLLKQFEEYKSIK